MSILIKNMQMPKTCGHCPFNNLGTLEDDCLIYECSLSGDFIRDGQPMVRLDTCPLVEIPNHGRLIDADEQIERVNRLNLYTADVVTELLNSAPVVIDKEVNE